MSVSKKGNIKCNKCGKKIAAESDAMTVDVIYPYDPSKTSYGKYKRFDFCKDCCEMFDKVIDNFVG